MKTYDVIPFGERQFLLHFWPVPAPLEQIERGRYVEANLTIISDGCEVHYSCLIHRPSRRRNFANQPIDCVYIIVKTDLTAKALYAALYQLNHVGGEISETQATAWRGYLKF
jgi:hypothetical protein